MRLAICPGSFDPITCGHVDVIAKAAALAERVVVAVGINSSKRCAFSIDRRVQLAKEALVDLPNVQVTSFCGLLADYCRQLQADAIVKGVRHGSDLDAEMPQAVANYHLSGIQTVFLVPQMDNLHISSTLVKDIASCGGDVTQMVPGVVQAALAELAGKGKEHD